MAGPEDFISPIIKAMLANAEFQQRGKQQAEEQRSNRENEKIRREQLKQASDFHTDEYKQAQMRLDAEVAHLHALMDNEHAQRQRQAREDVAKGLVKPQNVPGTVGVQQIPDTDLLGPTGSFQTPEDVLNLQNKATAGKITAEETAKAPFEQAARDDQFHKAVTVANIGANSKEDVARIADQTRRMIDQNKFDYQNQLLDIKRGQLLQGNANADQASKLYNDVYITGNTKLSSLTKEQKNQVINFAPPGHTPLDAKDSDSINGIPKVQDILNTAKDLAGYSLHPTSGTLSDTLQGQLGLGGKQQELKKSLKSQVEALVPIFARVSRFTETTIRNQLEGLYSATASPQENARNVARTEKFFDDIINPILGKYGKDQAVKILSNRDIAYKGYTIPGTDSPSTGTSGKTKSAIQLDDGTHVADTPANRLKYGIQ